MTPDPLPPRIVLDTNVCLDLFVFRDARCARLLDALASGAVQAVTRADCHAEWRKVLHYPRLPIDDGTRPGIEAAFDALVTPWSAPAPGLEPGLPRCADPDDQKFLELAWATGARWLLSKDNALLTLDRRTRALGLFRILLPQAWPPGPA